MSFNVDELRITSKEPEKQIEEMKRWMVSLAEKLNYSLNHLDETNFCENVSENVAGTKVNDATRAALEQQYRELRTLIVERTKSSSEEEK